MSFKAYLFSSLIVGLSLSSTSLSREGTHQSKKVRATSQVLELRSEKLAKLSENYKGTAEQKAAILAEFQKYLKESFPQSEKKILLKLGAPWCKPCAQIHPEIERFATRKAAEYVVISIDIDSYLGLSEALDLDGGVPAIYDLLRGAETSLGDSEDRIGPITSVPNIREYLNSK